jgi:hypothetical protein
VGLAGCCLRCYFDIGCRHSPDTVENDVALDGGSSKEDVVDGSAKQALTRHIE